MTLGDRLNALRNEAKLTQAKFAELFGVSQQSVQKWENGGATPELEKLVAIAKYFDASLDSLMLGNDSRTVEENAKLRSIKPRYQSLPDWELYSSNLPVEYRQATEEGLDVAAYEGVFSAVALLPKGEIKKKLGDALYEAVMTAKTREGYRYDEPNDLSRIKELRRGETSPLSVDFDSLPAKIYGAWTGRICGCLLGKTVEGVRTHELVPFLKETDNYPLKRYIYRSDVTPERAAKYPFFSYPRPYADEAVGMPPDDDTNYTVLYQQIISRFGFDFTSDDVGAAWLDSQSKNAYCTAERVAFCNLVKGFAPPQTAIYKNPYREWIGAQIRADYFGYICPGNPEKAAALAYRDGSLSHVKNGIYGEMFVAAMLAVAAATNDVETIIRGGLAQIPATSRLYEAITNVLDGYKSGKSEAEFYDSFYSRYDERSVHDWCHTISNAEIVAASLLYGEGDYARSICSAVQAGFDTDCNGATVGSILGMANGIDSIPDYWRKPVADVLHTTIFGADALSVPDLVAVTLDHIRNAK